MLYSELNEINYFLEWNESAHVSHLKSLILIKQKTITITIFNHFYFGK